MKSRSMFGGAHRHTGVGTQRFHVNAPHAIREDAALRANHPAVTEGRTLFPSTVVRVEDSPRVLVQGRNSAKIGDRIVKGPWSGLPVFTLTLEERATCPTSCGLWRECYGNSMPMARRHKHGSALVQVLADELGVLSWLHPKGIAVRLHVLGDFYSVDYAWQWITWMQEFPNLHVWGYTAHSGDSEIGAIVLRHNDLWPDRWAIRASVSPDAEKCDMQATTIWRQPESPNVPEGLVCPASLEKSAACVTCGLCWEPDAASKRIVFVGHGMRRHRGPVQQPDNFVARQVAHAGGSAAVAAGMRLGRQAVERWRHTGHVPEGKRDLFEQLCSDLGRRRSQVP